MVWSFPLEAVVKRVKPDLTVLTFPIKYIQPVGIQVCTIHLEYFVCLQPDLVESAGLLSLFTFSSLRLFGFEVHQNWS